MRTRTLALALAVVLLETAAAVAIVLSSDDATDDPWSAAVAITAGLSFVAAGLIALRRRPENRTGLYLAAIGYIWFFGALGWAESDWVFAIGNALTGLVFVPFVALLLSFPSGRLGPSDRRLVWATGVLVVLASLATLLFDPEPDFGCERDCRHSPLLLVDSDTLLSVLTIVFLVAVFALVGVLVAVLVRRWRQANRAQRRVLTPVYSASAGALVILVLLNLIGAASEDAAAAINPLFLVLFAAVPFAFLLGILRVRLARGEVAGLVVAIGQGTPLRDAIASALGDPTLEVAYRLEDGRLADRDGRPVALPSPESGRAATSVEHDGREVGALVHDASLGEEPELLDAVAAAVALVLDNERLEADLRAQYDFLQTIVDTAPSLLLSIDLEGRIRNLNPATVAASGYDDREDVRGRLFWEVFIDEPERDAMVERFRAAAPDHPGAEYENTFTNARGERLVIAWRSAPVLDDARRVVRIVAGGIDITDRKAQEEELRASRGRLVAAADDERRRLERNLHDGAQQRLVSLSVALRLAQAKLASDPAAAGAVLEGASEELAQALAELRELARGIHPAVLTDRGLAPALESLAARTPLPVELEVPGERLPPAVEAAAYYVVAEAVTNVVKHAEATCVTVRVAEADGSVAVEVCDDGVGAPDAAEGSGLRGLADRVAALDGRLRVEAPESGGTRVVAEIPLPAPEPAAVSPRPRPRS